MNRADVVDLDVDLVDVDLVVDLVDVDLDVGLVDVDLDVGLVDVDLDVDLVDVDLDVDLVDVDLVDIVLMSSGCFLSLASWPPAVFVGFWPLAVLNFLALGCIGGWGVSPNREI